MININNKKNIIILFLILFFILFLLQLCNELKNKFEKHAPPVLLTILTTESSPDIDELDFEVFRSSFRGKKYQLEMVSKSLRRIEYSVLQRYVKDIEIKGPLKHISEIRVAVKDREYKPDLSNLTESVVISSADIQLSRSFLPVIKKLINWCGDFYLAGYILLYTVIAFLFCLMIVYYLETENKIVYLALIGIIVVLALILRFTLPLTPVSSPDSSSYFNPALRLFENRGFGNAERSLLYPLFLLIVLVIPKDFTAVSIVQHLLGILTGFLLLNAWRMFYGFITNRNFKKYYDTAGILLLFFYLLNINIVRFEHSIAREALFPLFYLGVVNILLYTLVQVRRQKKLQSLIWLNLLFFSNILMYVFQPKWGFACGLVLVVYACCTFYLKAKLYKKILLLCLLPVIVSYCFAMYPAKLFTRGNIHSETFLPSTLLFWHFDLVEKEMIKDINDEAFTGYDKKVLANILNEYEWIKENSRKYKVLGFNPDLFMYGPTRKELYGYFKNDTKKYNSFCYSYFLKGVLKNPVGYTVKVFKQFFIFYKAGMYDHDFKIELYREQFSLYKGKQMPVLAAYAVKLDEVRSKKIHLYYRYFNFFPFLYALLNILYSPFIVFFLVIMVLLMFHKGFRELKKSYFFPGIITGIFLLQSILYNGLCAAVHSLEISRYIKEQFVMTLFTQFLVIFYCSMIIISFLSKKGKKNKEDVV